MLKYKWWLIMEVMDIYSLSNYIGVEDIPNDWIKYYSSAKDTFNKDWLNINFEEIIKFYDLNNDFKKLVLDEVEVLKKDVNLNFLAYLWYFIVFKNEDKYYIPRWSVNSCKDNVYMMNVVVLLMGYEIHKNVMRYYAEEQINYHKENIRLTCVSDSKRLGIRGIRFSQMIWGSRFMKGHIIQVGALQYELKKSYLNGEDVIFIHIPRGTSLDEESIKSSFRNVQSNVSMYLVTNKLRYVTESWLLSSDLKDILSSNSNIMKFQNYFHIIEYKENVKDFLNFVFNVNVFDGNYESLVCDTTLQKGLKRKLLAGEKLCVGIGILK